MIPFSLQYFGLIKKNLKILHIAPNVNEYNYVKSNFDTLLCYDRLDIKKRKHTNIKQDITQMNIADNTYNLVIAWHVFEHIKDDIKAISEIYRVLKPTGYLLVSVPIYPIGSILTYEDNRINYKDYYKIHGHHDHCRSCGLDYYKRFESVGFKTKVLDLKKVESIKMETFGLLKEHVVWCFNK
ncbi:class I SAM-dependent methyltransferase [Yeosuana sp. MJ-SS3]|uniref:Class I SAM-dependent methyltransferase n=1 Tax=Gilvirhabdus luticola TaxID=3079858 RepID=A0ABU3U558_9FLAO|nr:class I SAM-dependent methyltransferase [Yeosuana sp. MJ-SS3]MDU8885461.1 class I SAM-dependent methyltransferase [Yeosuana sp. MJ-SS3]